MRAISSGYPTKQTAIMHDCQSVRIEEMEQKA